MVVESHLGELSSKVPSDPLKVILNAPIHCRLFLEDESKLWLTMINRRLRAKTSIRHPYRCEITRVIPFQVVSLMRDAILHPRNNVSSDVFPASNKKWLVVSFPSKQAVIVLLSMLSRQGVWNVESQLRKKLKGRVSGRAEVITNVEKDFAFIYKVKTSELTITFHYGVWNKHGLPQHN